MTAPTAAGTRRALLIAISEYNPPTSPLEGCVNDAKLVRQVLEQRYGFTDIREVFNAEATGDNMVKAFNELTARTQPGDEVVIYYAGHGSTCVDIHGDEPSGLDSTFHAVDSGGFKDNQWIGPNNDVTDDEIGAFIRKLTAVTDRVAMIVDACHSGGISRSSDALTARDTPGDPRPGPGPGDRVRVVEQVARRTDGRRIAGDDVANRYVLIAGCRDAEKSYELTPKHEPEMPASHGALTFYLTRALTQAEPGSTWRDVFERAASDVSVKLPAQHPQFEGRIDREIFGDGEYPPAPYLLVSEVRPDGTIVLDGGASHGVTAGSVYAVHPPRSRGAGAGAPPPLAEATVVQVKGTQAIARLNATPAPAAVPRLARAFELHHAWEANAWRIAIEAPATEQARADALRAELGKQARCPVAAPGESGDLRAVLAPSGSGLGWTLRDADGHEVAPALTAGHEALMAYNAATLSRWLQVRHRQNERSQALRSGVSLSLELRAPGYTGDWRPVAAGGDGGVIVQEGEYFRVVFTRGEGVPPYYASLLYLDAGGGISHLWPSTTMPPVELPRFVAAAADNATDAWHFLWTEGGLNPQQVEARGGRTALTEYLVAIVSEKQASYVELQQAGMQLPSRGVGGQLATGNAAPVEKDDWAVIVLPVQVWRTT